MKANTNKMAKIICKNCNNEINGKYCSQCGEKIIDDSDLTIKSIIGQAIGSITNFDSKLFKTLKLLFFYPGKLTSKFVEGVRVPYMKPFQIFVISNIIFFIFLAEVDLFRTPSKWFFVEDFDGIKVMEKVRQICGKSGLEETEIAFKYDKKSSDLAKGLIVFLIPFIAIIGKLLNPSREIVFGKHIVFSTHYFSFVLLMFVIVSEIIKMLTNNFNKWLFIIPITLLMIIYYSIGLKKFYHTSWIMAVLKGIVGVFLINVFIQFYRVLINLISLNTL